MSPVDGFDPREATVAGIDGALAAGRTTVRELVEAYRERIADHRELNAVLSLNPDAGERARALDARRERGDSTGPLHGVPVVVKDNCDTAGPATTAGSRAMADVVPARDATVVRRLRAAGAVVLAKTNLDEFARDWHGYSPLGGWTHNPYDRDRITGGSSSGTAAAVAASLGAAGVGTDTVGSVRIPAAMCSLVGVRPTVGLVGRTGVFPIAPSHDAPGPMARTVADAAALLDALAGEDAGDPATDGADGRIPDEGYAAGVADPEAENPPGDARIGVVEAWVEEDGPGAPVAAVFADARRALTAAGATLPAVDPGTEPDEAWRECYVGHLEARSAVEDYLAGVGDPDAPADLAALLERPVGDHARRLLERAAAVEGDPREREGHRRRRAAAADLRERVVAAMDRQNLAALAYPSVRRPPVRIGEDYPRSALNTPVAAMLDLPAVTVPAGYTDAGLPVGLELVGRRYDERRLLALAADVEATLDARRPPGEF